LREIDVATAPEWLKNHGLRGGAPCVRELGGGVSNIVILAESEQYRIVLKQALGRLRVTEEWCSDRDRIFREAAAMRWLAPRISAGRIPALLLEDRTDFTIAMQAAPREAEMWKTKLFRGEIDAAHARAAGELLAETIAVSWNDPEARRIFGDTTVFDQLRIDPYYRFTAHRHPDLARYFHDLIARSRARAVSLVHGDWSPKNLLIASDGMWAIDWEVVHFGDPSFDAAFLLNHLLLKSLAMPENRARLAELARVFCASLREKLPPEGRWIMDAALEHLPALLLARVDGKSPAEYLDAKAAERARVLARETMLSPASSVEVFFKSEN